MKLHNIFVAFVSILFLKTSAISFAAAIPALDAATGLGSAGSAATSAADLQQQMQKCQQKQAKTPPEPCNPELEKAGQDAGQIGQSLGELMKALGQLASAKGQKGDGPYDKAFANSDFSFKEPEKLKTALTAIGATPKEIRGVFKAKETLDEAEKSGFLNNPTSQAAMAGGGAAAALSSEGMKNAEKEFEELKKRAEKAIAENLPSLSIGFGDGGGGSAATGGSLGAADGSEEVASEDDPFKLDIPKPQHTTAEGDPLAPPTADIFKVLSKRYQIRKTAGQFLP